MVFKLMSCCLAEMIEAFSSSELNLSASKAFSMFGEEGVLLLSQGEMCD